MSCLTVIFGSAVSQSDFCGMDADHEFVAGERIHQPEVSGPHENTIGLKTRKAVKPGCYPNRLIERKPLRLKLLGDSLRVERNENVAQFFFVAASVRIQSVATPWLS